MAPDDERSVRDHQSAFIARLRQATVAEADDQVLVFGDWLQSVGDPWGELIAIQHALETAPEDRRVALREREQQLIAGNELLRPDDKLVWRRGFVRRLTFELMGPVLDRLLDHRMLQLVRELELDFTYQFDWTIMTERLPRPLPSTLRALELHSGTATAIGGLGRLSASELPHLERLLLDGPALLGTLAHPTLADLTLACWDARASRVATFDDSKPFIERVAELVPDGLPKLSRLVLSVTHGFDEALEALAATSILDRISVLGLHGPDLSRESLSMIRRRGLRLARLELGPTRVGHEALGDLSSLAKELVVDKRRLAF